MSDPKITKQLYVCARTERRAVGKETEFKFQVSKDLF